MATSYQTAEEREAYARRLFNRMWSIIGEEAPDRTLFREDDVWVSIDPADREVSRAWDGWLAGEVTREDFDKAATDYLTAWRKLMSERRKPQPARIELTDNVIDMFGGEDRPGPPLDRKHL